VAEEVEPTEPADVNSKGEEPVGDRRAALLRSLAQRRFPDLEGEQLEKLREPRHSGTDS
jgi:hypothetical protein